MQKIARLFLEEENKRMKSYFFRRLDLLACVVGVELAPATVGLFTVTWLVSSSSTDTSVISFSFCWPSMKNIRSRNCSFRSSNSYEREKCFTEMIPLFSIRVRREKMENPIVLGSSVSSPCRILLSAFAFPIENSSDSVAAVRSSVALHRNHAAACSLSFASVSPAAVCLWLTLQRCFATVGHAPWAFYSIAQVLPIVRAWHLPRIAVCLRKIAVAIPIDWSTDRCTRQASNVHHGYLRNEDLLPVPWNRFSLEGYQFSMSFRRNYSRSVPIRSRGKDVSLTIS